MYVGEGEALLRNTFRRARLAAPSILFFDEADILAARRLLSSLSHPLPTPQKRKGLWALICSLYHVNILLVDFPLLNRSASLFSAIKCSCVGYLLIITLCGAPSPVWVNFMAKLNEKVISINR